MGRGSKRKGEHESFALEVGIHMYLGIGGQTIKIGKRRSPTEEHSESSTRSRPSDRLHVGEFLVLSCRGRVVILGSPIPQVLTNGDGRHRGYMMNMGGAPIMSSVSRSSLCVIYRFEKIYYLEAADPQT